jgi:SHS2 domain-containing protein
MKRFQVLPHTADSRLLVQADTLPELFKAALEGMNQILKKGFSLSAAPVKEKLSLSAADSTGLLIDFLSQVLSLSLLKQAVFNQVDFKQISETALTAELTGSPVGRFDKEIKAVTYHEAAVTKNAEGLWETKIVFDI